MNEINNASSFLPHGIPFLFVDSAEISEDFSSIITTHEFLSEEPYFEGHFPGEPIVPGVILLECMAQAARLLLNFQAGEIIPGYLVGVESAKFNRVITPGMTVQFQASLVLESSRPPNGGGESRILSFKCTGFQDGVRCVRARLKLYQAKNAQVKLN